jgi:phenylacetate-CoA ligase
LPKADIQAIASELQHRIRSLAGIAARVSVMAFDTIPRTQVGKARRVLDERPKQD